MLTLALAALAKNIDDADACAKTSSAVLALKRLKLLIFCHILAPVTAIYCHTARVFLVIKRSPSKGESLINGVVSTVGSLTPLYILLPLCPVGPILT